MLGVCECFISQDNSCAGVHSSWIDLTSSEANLSSPCYLDKPKFVGLDEFCVPLATCELDSVPLIPFGIIPSSGVAVLPRD